jgi:hypothetical protein
LRFIEGCRRHTRIAIFREAQIYGRIEVRDSIAAEMLQVLWKAYRQGNPRFDYNKFKIMLTFLTALRKTSRIVSFRDAFKRRNIILAKNFAATMLQLYWKAYKVRRQKGIRRHSISRAHALRT